MYINWLNLNVNVYLHLNDIKENPHEVGLDSGVLYYLLANTTVATIAVTLTTSRDMSVIIIQSVWGLRLNYSR